MTDQSMTPAYEAAVRAELARQIMDRARAIPRRQRSHRTALLETTAIYPTRQGVFKVFAMCGVKQS